MNAHLCILPVKSSRRFAHQQCGINQKNRRRSIMMGFLLRLFQRQSLLVVGTVLLLLAQVVSSEIVSLTDATFEHQTQASTGGTTGSWLVLFTHSTTCGSVCDSILKNVMQPLDGDAELYDRGVVMGTVDAAGSPATATRFEITNFPSLIYLHKKRLYHLPISVSEENPATPEGLKSFVLNGFAQEEFVESKAIPPPPSTTSELGTVVNQIFQAFQGEHGLVGKAIVTMVLSMIATTVALIFAVARVNANKKKEMAKKK